MQIRNALQQVRQTMRGLLRNRGFVAWGAEMRVDFLVDMVFIAIYAPLLWRAWQWLRTKVARRAAVPAPQSRWSTARTRGRCRSRCWPSRILAGSPMSFVVLGFLALVITESAGATGTVGCVQHRGAGAAPGSGHHHHFFFFFFVVVVYFTRRLVLLSSTALFQYDHRLGPVNQASHCSILRNH